MPQRPYAGPRGSSAQPLLREYLTANMQQGAQQAQEMAAQLGQQQQSTRAAVDAGEAEVTRKRLEPALGNVGQIGGSVPGINPAPSPAPTAAQAQAVLDQPETEMAGAGELAGQVARTEDQSALATTPAGLAAMYSQRYGAPRSAGSSMFDAAVTGHGGGAQLRAAARPAQGLREYLSGATRRGNEAANARARQWLPPPAPTLTPTPERQKPSPGRPTMPGGAGKQPRLRDWVRERKESEFEGYGP